MSLSTLIIQGIRNCIYFTYANHYPLQFAKFFNPNGAFNFSRKRKLDFYSGLFELIDVDIPFKSQYILKLKSTQIK